MINPKRLFLYMDIKSKIIDAEGFDRILTRMAHEILEKNKGSHNFVLM